MIPLMLRLASLDELETWSKTDLSHVEKWKVKQADLNNAGRWEAARKLAANPEILVTKTRSK